MRSILTWRPGPKDLAEVLLLASALPLYYLVRGIAHQQVEDALSRGADLIRLERSLGIFWEAELQSLVLSYEWLVKALNAFYLYGHLPVVGALALWLYFWHRSQYFVMRNAFLISGAIGLVIYVTFPVAPPRFLPEWGFVDTVLGQYNTGRPLTPGFFVNEYAAMPSLHFGWNMLVGIGAWRASRSIDGRFLPLFIRIFAVVMPLAMLMDIILTANHYFIDAAAGIVVVLVGMGIAEAGRKLVIEFRRRDTEPNWAAGWRGWLSWLCGIGDEPATPETAPAQA